MYAVSHNAASTDATDDSLDAVVYLLAAHSHDAARVGAPAVGIEEDEKVEPVDSPSLVWPSRR